MEVQFQNLVKTAAEKVDMSQVRAIAFSNALLAEMRKSLISGDCFRLRGIGFFCHENRKSRMFHSNITGEDGVKTIIRFKAAPAVNEQINDRIENVRP